MQKYDLKTKEGKNAYQREWARNNPEKTKKWAQNYYEQNSIEVKKQAAQRNKLIYEKQKENREFPYHTFNNSKNRAKKHGLDFTIKREDFELPDICPVLGIPLNWETRDNWPSIDRIDNTKGYIPGNVIIVSYKANAAKRNLTNEELEKIAKFYGTYTSN